MNDNDTVMQDDDLGRPVRVRWMDSGLALTGWKQKTELPSFISPVESVGLWMGENDEVVMMAGAHDEDNHNWLNVQLIWKPSVIVKEWLS